MNANCLNVVAGIMIVIATCVSVSLSQLTAFTYRGTLNDNGVPANGQYQFAIRLEALSLATRDVLGNASRRRPAQSDAFND